MIPKMVLIGIVKLCESSREYYVPTVSDAV